MSKEQVLACMGPPANKAAEGVIEVWSYNSGNNQTTVSTFGTSNTNASVYGNRNAAWRKIDPPCGILSVAIG